MQDHWKMAIGQTYSIVHCLFAAFGTSLVEMSAIISFKKLDCCLQAKQYCFLIKYKH